MPDPMTTQTTEADRGLYERTADGVCSLGDNRRTTLLGKRYPPEEEGSEEQ